jgi:excisionase family DNA binding protein
MMGNGLMWAAAAALVLGGCERTPAKVEETPTVEEVLPQPGPANALYSVGNARDGDDIEFSVRMQGFDTPERGKTCGEVNVWRGARDALDALGVGRTTLYAAIAAERLVAVKLGNRTLIPAESLRAWIASMPAVRRTR